MNTITNNMPFELHASGYNFRRPGNKLDKGLTRRDVVNNTLEEPAKEQDIWYSL